MSFSSLHTFEQIANSGQFGKPSVSKKESNPSVKKSVSLLRIVV